MIRNILSKIYHFPKVAIYYLAWQFMNFLGRTDDIIYYCYFPLHYVIFQDIHKFMPDIKIVVPKTKDITNYLQNRGIKYCHKSYPKIVIMSEFYPRRFPIKSIKKIYIPHGLVGKNYMFDYHRNKFFDLILQPGEYSVERLRKSGLNNCVKVGYPVLDRLFNGSLNRNKILEEIGADVNKKTVLYAPTWGPISSLHAIGGNIDKVAKSVNILIKLHPGFNDDSIFEENKKHNINFRNMKNAILIEDFADAIPYLFASDVLISDYSSMIFKFACMDKPVVMFNTHNTNDPMYDPESMEITMRDIGESVNTFEELQQAVKRALEHPEINSEKRKMYSEKLFYKLDGKSAERFAFEIKNFSKKYKIRINLINAV
ncbi:MAG: CDP-glycerol glycerophosphotransferase family protein [Endomicrobiales bacterium]|nr:CDP-glycerol glycerophosphotransferase family protein [Endomicrobiales bacterium]